MPVGKEQRTGFRGHAFYSAKVNSDPLNCLGGRAEAGRREQKAGDNFELACVLEERSGDGSGSGRVKNIPKIAEPEPKAAS